MTISVHGGGDTGRHEVPVLAHMFVQHRPQTDGRWRGHTHWQIVLPGGGSGRGLSNLKATTRKEEEEEVEEEEEEEGGWSSVAMSC